MIYGLIEFLLTAFCVVICFVFLVILFILIYCFIIMPLVDLIKRTNKRRKEKSRRYKGILKMYPSYNIQSEWMKEEMGKEFDKKQRAINIAKRNNKIKKRKNQKRKRK